MSECAFCKLVADKTANERKDIRDNNKVRAMLGSNLQIIKCLTKVRAIFPRKARRKIW